MEQPIKPVTIVHDGTDVFVRRVFRIIEILRRHEPESSPKPAVKSPPKKQRQKDL